MSDASPSTGPEATATGPTSSIDTPSSPLQTPGSSPEAVPSSTKAPVQAGNTPDKPQTDQSGSRSLRLAMKKEAEAKKAREEAESLHKDLQPFLDAKNTKSVGKFLEATGLTPDELYQQLLTLNQQQEEANKPETVMSKQLKELQDQLEEMKEKEDAREKATVQAQEQKLLANAYNQTVRFIDTKAAEYPLCKAVPDAAVAILDVFGEMLDENPALDNIEAAAKVVEDRLRENLKAKIESNQRDKAELETLSRLLTPQTPPGKPSDASPVTAKNKESQAPAPKPAIPSLTQKLASSHSGQSTRKTEDELRASLEDTIASHFQKRKEKS